jgi:serine/threonine protein phosphatase 1
MARNSEPTRRRLNANFAWELGSDLKGGRSPRIPDGIRIYAIGDLHGRADLLEQMFSRIDADLNRHPTERAIQIFLGDYVDRGPASRVVLDQMVERAKTHELVCLKGNHESLMMNFLKNPAVLDAWQHLGGLETLLSYGLMPPMKTDAPTKANLAAKLSVNLHDTHRDFLCSLKLSFTCGDFFFTHAGVRPGVPLSQQQEKDLLWIREEFLLSDEVFGKVVIHGHSPVLEPDVRFNRINLDTGAYATGQLSCLRLEEDELVLFST